MEIIGFPNNKDRTWDKNGKDACFVLVLVWGAFDCDYSCMTID